MRKAFNFLVIAIVAMALLCYGYKYFNSDNDVTCDTITLERTDTIIDTIRVTETRWKTKEIIKERRITDTIQIQKDTTLYREHKHYQDTLNLGDGKVKLDVYLSGVDPTLDSTKIEAKIPHYNTTIENVITKTVTKKKHFIYAPTVGVGYGLVNHKPDVFVGFSVGWQF